MTLGSWLLDLKGSILWMDGEPGVIHDDSPGVTIQGCDKADTSLCSDIPLNQLKKETSHSHGDK